MQTGNIEKLAQPVRYMDSFIKPKSRAPMRGVPDPAHAMQEATLTLVDIARGGALDHVNRKHVVSEGYFF